MTSPEPTPGPRVVVVGAGIAGLAAARAILDRLPSARLTVLEGSPEIGGKLRLAQVAGVGVDVGAEAMLHRRPEATALARRVGLGEDLVHPVTTSSSLWNRGRLVPLPRTVMGVPGRVEALRQVVSRRGRFRASLEPRLPRTRLAEGEDIGIGKLVQRRLGAEVVDRLLEPLLGGVYAGHARELSARAAVPQILRLLEEDRSLLRAAAASLGPAASSEPVFAGLRGGVGRLPGAVARSLSRDGAQVRTGAVVRELARTPEGWRLVVGETRGPETIEADAVVLATPAPATARLLGAVAPAAAAPLGGIDYASMAIVTLALPRDRVAHLGASGFLVPPVDGRRVKAATYSFRKWAWVEEAGGAEEVALVRCSLGRYGDEQALQVEDEELVRRAVTDLSAALDLPGPPLIPVASHVQRWGGALPQYAVGHLDRIAAVRTSVAEVSGLAVCGAAYDGVGIPACIASARAAAEKLTQDLARMAP